MERLSRFSAWIGLAAAAVAAVALRLTALRSDAYLRLDWSAGLLTDEGFYMHNARNLALFGSERTDEFNNMLVSPVLHYLQVGVFGLFGSGSIQARLISVVLALFTICLVYDACRRAFGRPTAIAAGLFLALDHTYLLYSRMALMDTPAVFLASASFWAFVRSVPASGTVSLPWLAASGVCLGLALAARSLLLFAVPAPVFAIWWLLRVGHTPSARVAAMRSAAWLSGLTVVGALYVAWSRPYSDEIRSMNSYYRSQQLQPKSPSHLASNFRIALFGDRRGYSAYLVRHTPVAFGLAIVWLITGALSARARRRESAPSDDQRAAAARAFVAAWLIGGAFVLAMVAYSPSRYYVNLYPALAVAAGLGLATISRRFSQLAEHGSAPAFARSALIGFAVYHLILAFVHQPDDTTSTLVTTIQVAPAVAAALAALVASRHTATMVQALSTVSRPRVTAAIGVVWLACNGYWLLDWARSIEHTQHAASRDLARLLPAGSVLIGDVAPGLCLDNRFAAINVIPKLCNATQPVERFAGRPRYVAILDGRWKEKYWVETYPEIVKPHRRVWFGRVMRWNVGIYSVDGPSGHASSLAAGRSHCARAHEYNWSSNA